MAHGGGGCAGIGSSYTGCGDITITGSANVTATGGDGGAGIGSGMDGYCGDITISTTGTVTAQGGESGAGIGSGYAREGTSQCGNILISKGTIVATGGYYAAGIGTGFVQEYHYPNVCGTITIEDTVTSITVTKKSSATDSIGRGSSYDSNKCGTITIGGTVYWGLRDGFTDKYEYEPGGWTYLTTSPLEYPQP